MLAFTFECDKLYTVKDFCPENVTLIFYFILFLFDCFLLFHKQNQEKEVLQKKWQIAQEFSDLVIYCRSTPYQPEG